MRRGVVWGVALPGPATRCKSRQRDDLSLSSVFSVYSRGLLVAAGDSARRSCPHGPPPPGRDTQTMPWRPGPEMCPRKAIIGLGPVFEAGGDYWRKWGALASPKRRLATGHRGRGVSCVWRCARCTGRETGGLPTRGGGLVGLWRLGSHPFRAPRAGWLCPGLASRTSGVRRPNTQSCAGPCVVGSLETRPGTAQRGPDGTISDQGVENMDVSERGGGDRSVFRPCGPRPSRRARRLTPARPPR